jgi:tRNA (mo5U34)-methyltransferase
MATLFQLRIDRRHSMNNSDHLFDQLRSIGLNDWPAALSPMIEERLSPKGHGDFSKWQAIVDALPSTQDDVVELRKLLLGLSPWRKGPIDIGGVNIDTEWRSDRKWNRVRNFIAPLNGRNVLDVGCGNGYYAWQMANAGARCVIGVDPTVLFVMQFLAMNSFANLDNVFVIPARLEELPLPARKFDTTFSMGVLYHRRSPIDHLQELRQTLRQGGQLVLETIYLPGDKPFARTPEDRYARMRNVWLLPTIPELEIWLGRTGFKDIAVVDKSITSSEEQRSTEWMSFESLHDALDPDDPTLTVEGWPAPRRVVITATAP